TNKKSKLDIISGFFRKWSNKLPQCDDRVVFDPSHGDDGQVWQDKLQFFVEPQTTTTTMVNLHEFNFAAMTLEKAFRILYKTFDVKSQESLLYDFSRRYLECNPRCMFGTIRVIHLIVCALVLLSTQKQLSQTIFVQDTMNVIYRQIGSSAQKTKTHRLNAEHLNWLFYNGAIHDDAFMPHDLSAMIFGSLAWQSEIKTILKNMYTSIKSKPLEEGTTRISIITSPSMYHTFSGPVSSSSSSSSSDDSEDDDDDESVDTKLNSVTGLEMGLPSRFLKNAPYYKDGLLSCKCVLQDNKIVKQSWKTFFVMVESSHLYLFPTQITETTANNDTSNKETIILKHSISSILPFGYNRKRPHCFSIKLADGSAYIFETKSIYDTKEWISTCNYWAARASHSSSTLLDERTQLEMLQAHINTLFSELDKKKRSTSLLREMMKYQTYCNSIESSLAFQIKMMSFVH
ncbi:hypothetical protein K501DRAFT_302432, partial [Backusella circina FSU 941]